MMRQTLLGGVAGQIREQGRFTHGGDLRRLAEAAGCRPEEILDFSVCLNPLGPPPWLAREAGRALAQAASYPDPECGGVTLAAAERYKVWPNQVMAGNGASELIQAVTRLRPFSRAVIPVPTYSDYFRACRQSGLAVRTLPLDQSKGFALDFAALEAALEPQCLVFLCLPNNPTGKGFDAQALRDLAGRRPDCLFAVDESFADFAPDLDRLTRRRPDNVVVILSLTKLFSMPGLRLGLAFSTAERIAEMKALLPPWSVNVLAQRIGARGLRDAAYLEETRRAVRDLRLGLEDAIRGVPGFFVLPCEANWTLCRVMRVGMTARQVFDRLLSERIAVRVCDNFEGLDDTWFRVGLRSAADNERLAEALRRMAGVSRPPAPEPRPRTPAIMVQGTCSNAGKSLLAAALCRIFLQDGLRPAPFKAQNMSLNSFVTSDGREIGRAQATQAQACRLAPDARMNPVLLKPGSDTGSQVIVMGRPVGHMNVQQYIAYKPEAFAQVKRAYDSLAAEADVMVIEGAGSPAEINLKAHDIVNMKMAEYAGAGVLLAGDIDRGGVFAALLGTMELLTEAERGLVLGYVLNKFRGDKSLLEPACTALFERTGRPVLGVVPWLADLGLPEEDSVSLRAAPRKARPGGTEVLDIVCLDLPRISNFNDLDPLAAEPDVRLRMAASALDIGRPDCVILPGSKSTVPDMRSLKGSGVAAVLRTLAADPAGPVIVGICAGLQMLGAEIHDPLGLESDARSIDGFGILPLTTSLAREKTLTRIEARHVPSGLTVRGYEIHHGVSRPLAADAEPAVLATDGAELGWGLPDGRAWGTYLHGIFDDDFFRRNFLDGLRRRRGLKPLKKPQTAYDLEPALDRLAQAVRQALDMPRIYRALGLRVTGRDSLI